MQEMKPKFLWELDQDSQRNQSKIRISFQSILLFFTISGNFVTDYSALLHSFGWLNSRELILGFRLCTTFSPMVLWHREYNIKTKAHWVSHRKAPSGPIPCSPNTKCSEEERKKLGEHEVNFPSGNPWCRKISDLSLPKWGTCPRLLGWPVPHEFSSLK